MDERESDLVHKIAIRARELRQARGLSLEGLAAKTGVSRSMISLIERGESSPTAVLLEKLSAGLGVPLSALFEAPAAPPAAPVSPVARRDEQTQWQDPDSGYVRRNLSPSGVPQPIRLVEVHFPAGATVAFESAARDVHIHQQVWILSGTMEIRSGSASHRLAEGDCLAMDLDQPVHFHNPGKKAAHYVVVTASEAAHRP